MKTSVNGKEVPNNCWYKPHEIEGEVNNMPSETIPDQAIPIEEMLKKSLYGINPAVVKQPQYSDIDDLEQPVLERMVDITEVEGAYFNAAEKLIQDAKNRQAKPADFSGKNPDDSGGDA